MMHTSRQPAGELPRLVYILAASHSGSTLLAMLLAAHPDICTAGELSPGGMGNSDDYRCSCRELIKHCPFWQQVLDAMAERGSACRIDQLGTDFRTCESGYARRLLRPLCHGRTLEGLRDAALSLSGRWRTHYRRVHASSTALLASLRQVSGCTIVVDSSKVGLRLKYLLRNPQLDVQVIRLIRDGRGVALTYMDPAQFADAREPGLRGGGLGHVQRHARLSMPEAAHEWKRSQEEAQQVIARLASSQWTEVRYEDLCNDVEQTMSRLYSFLGLDTAGVVSDFRAVEHHVVGNGMRLDTSSRVRLDDRWRSALSSDELSLFERVAGSLNRGFGYA